MSLNLSGCINEPAPAGSRRVCSRPFRLHQRRRRGCSNLKKPKNGGHVYFENRAGTGTTPAVSTMNNAGAASRSMNRRRSFVNQNRRRLSSSLRIPEKSPQRFHVGACCLLAINRTGRIKPAPESRLMNPDGSFPPAVFPVYQILDFFKTASTYGRTVSNSPTISR